jgi:hypothetical protein
VAETDPSLTPGIAWHLDPQGQWKTEKLPPDVLSGAAFSGFLTVEGYRASVFETPEGDQWAQKSTGTPSTASSAVSRPGSLRRTQMGPKQTAEHLRQIASKLDKSSTPNKALVIRDLKFVLANMTNVGEQQQEQQSQQQQGQQQGYGQQEQQSQQQQEALPQSGTGKNMLKKMLDDAQKALEAGDEAGFKGALEKALKHG